MKRENNRHFKALASSLQGELHTDKLTKALYATDASVYRIMPEAVAYPASASDLQSLIAFAQKHRHSLIPRTAGTSLAGQCVGKGIVVDLSKHFTDIYEIDVKARTVTVAPGVIRDELNSYLEPHGLFFGPNTSTANRCMIGGMAGNNSSGTTSIRYGVTRDKVLKMELLLVDGSCITAEPLTKTQFFEKCKQSDLEGQLYKTIYECLNNPEAQKRIHTHFPKPEIHRRNTGYAIDELLKSDVFTPGGPPFNLCKLLVGSEGTLAMTTKLTVQLDPLPPPEVILIAAHFQTIEDCLQAVAPLMQHKLYSCEMMDKVILDCTKGNHYYREHRALLEGDPMAILLLEVRGATAEAVQHEAQKIVNNLQMQCKSYAYPLLKGDAIDKALELRKAGLGLLGSIVGDRKAVACIEDTAVAVADLADYIAEFTNLMKKHKQQAVYYAHAGAGELHLRPILNLKKTTDVALFKIITTEVAQLVKRYRGSMSGEHGDGIVRSTFIEEMIGAENYQLLQTIKTAFDPYNIMNPGKIVNPLPMDANLRYIPERTEPSIETKLNFEDSQGILRHAEQCNGSGDCRKGETAGGTMCPSYRATKDEKDTTRARANALREFLTHSGKPNRFDHEELKTVFDLCVSCKGCKTECPSGVDVAALKAEWQYQYRKNHRTSLRDYLFAYNHQAQLWLKKTHPFSTLLIENKLSQALLKKVMGVAPQRALPKVASENIFSAYKHLRKRYHPTGKKVYFFVDEFTETLDTHIGIDALEVLLRLNYDVHPLKHKESGRALLSKGFLDKAKKCANANVAYFSAHITAETPLIGLEPSAILTFRDEYLRLADDRNTAKRLSESVFLIDEFIASEVHKGHITPTAFTKSTKTIKLHGHCHQKALSSVADTFTLLNLPQNYTVRIIPSGCCGMAGSFGYEKDHYDISMRMGELTLFKAIRKTTEDVFIAATGTSCRHQIFDGTRRTALHPISILKEALR